MHVLSFIRSQAFVSHLLASFRLPLQPLKLFSLRSQTMPESCAATNQEAKTSQAGLILRNLDPQSDAIRPPNSNTFKHFEDCRRRNEARYREWCPFCYLKDNFRQAEVALNEYRQMNEYNDKAKKWKRKVTGYIDNSRQALYESEDMQQGRA